MVRHYVPKHKAWQYTLSSIPIQQGSYEPNFQHTFPDAPKEVEVLGDIVDMTGEPQQPASREEYRVYQALKYFDIPFRYQYSIMGGRRVRGGQIIDFYCETAPQPTLIYCQSYWHAGQKGVDRNLQIASASSYFGNEVRVVEIWDYENKSVDEALHQVKQRVM